MSEQQNAPDDSEPSPERQAELRAAYEANVEAGKAPYDAVAIRTRGELHWVMHEREWSGELEAEGKERANLTGADFTSVDLPGTHLCGANLIGAELSNANLSGSMLNAATLSDANLTRATLSDANLTRATLSDANLADAILIGAYLINANLNGSRLFLANLSGATLYKATLIGADLREANLSRANLTEANLSGAKLPRANLSHAYLGRVDLSRAFLQAANLSGANLPWVNLSGADLRGVRMDVDTNLAVATLNSETCLADVRWNGVQLTFIDWKRAPQLGDEQDARDWKAEHFTETEEQRNKPRSERAQARAKHAAEQKQRRLWLYQAAVRAYRQLATVLREQGLNDEADHYAERGQVMQRRLLWQRRNVIAWAFRLIFLEWLAGYGYGLWNILIAYGLVLTVFAVIFYAVGVPVPPTTHLTTLQAVGDAFQLSLTAVHGRVFFEQLGLGSAVAWTAAIESVLGIVIEGVFVAMLVQRFFAS
jgi:uncharacterized protein YjbI with pentapeptide repeats